MSDEMLAARYAMHCCRVAQYATLALNGVLTDEQARQEYAAAMENYDGLIHLADVFRDGNAADLEKGADAVTEVIEAERARRADV